MHKHIFFSIIALCTWAFAACTGKQASTLALDCATFNIRYDNPEDSLNNWKYRKDSVAAFIRAHNLDVVGCQEVLYHQLTDLQERLPEYSFVGVCRDDGDRAGEAAPIFYRKDRFELLGSNTFWLSQYPDSVGFIGWDGACCRIATWAKLRERQTGRVFMAVNTHFDHVGTEARRKAALLIIDSIRSIVGDQPAILTGDFNVNDQSEAYRTITTNEFVLRDAFKIAEKREGVEWTFHDWGKIPEAECEKIDFIFVTATGRVTKCVIPHPGAGPTGYLSDHNPHFAHVEF